MKRHMVFLIHKIEEMLDMRSIRNSKNLRKNCPIKILTSKNQKLTLSQLWGGY